MEYYALLILFLILALLGVLFLMRSYIDLNTETNGTPEGPGLVGAINEGIGLNNR
jgi:hypothetical protein